MISITFHGSHIGQQHLIFNQQQLEDEYKFSHYKIHEGTIIRIPCQMDKVYLISVKPAARISRIRLEVTGSETISNLKVRLWDRRLNPRSISKNIQSQLGS